MILIGGFFRGKLTEASTPYWEPRCRVQHLGLSRPLHDSHMSSPQDANSSYSWQPTKGEGPSDVLFAIKHPR